MKLKTETVVATSKISLGGFTSKKDRKRKREVSTASDSDDNPLSLRHFASPMASRIKKEKLVGDDKVLKIIPGIGKEAKPPVKKTKVESAGNEGGTSAKTLDVDVSMQQAIEMVRTHKVLQAAGERLWFASYPQSDDDEQTSPPNSAPSHSKRLTTTPLNASSGEAVAGTESMQKSEQQLKEEQSQASHGANLNPKQEEEENEKKQEAPKLAKKERKEMNGKKVQAEQAAAKTKKQQKAERKKKVDEAAEAKKQEKAKKAEDKKKKSEKKLLQMGDKMSQMSRGALKNWVNTRIRRAALMSLRYNPDGELVKDGLKFAMQAVEDEVARLEEKKGKKKRKAKFRDLSKSIKQEDLKQEVINEG